jgi:hypothetical protein
MNLHTALSLAALSLAAALFLVPAEQAAGCAVAPRVGDSVQIADESAIIIWDAASKTEHFIRRATFSANAHDFGFLVPTPTKPELAEAGDVAFTTLAELTKPKVVTRAAPPSGGGGCGCGYGAPGAHVGGDSAPPKVSVLESKRVGDFHAAVLEADDAGALAKWLKDHGYESSPALAEWAAPYVKAKWKFSAFKIARDDPETPGGNSARAAKADGSSPSPAAGAVSTTAVRMTFHTEHPFFPYREPQGQLHAKSGPDPRRLLRVYFLAEGRVKGTLGEGGQPWPGHVVWANNLENVDREKVLGELKLPKDTPPGSWWLTEFEDHSSPRPGTDDVYFAPDDDQRPVERPPVIEYVSSGLPGCVMCYALALYVLVPGLVRSWRRRGVLRDGAGAC